VEALRQLTTASKSIENGEQLTESVAELAPGSTTGSTLAATEESETVNADCEFRTPSTSGVEILPVASTSACGADTPASECGLSLNSPDQMAASSSADLANSSYVKDFSRLVVNKMMNGDADNSLNNECGKSSLPFHLFGAIVRCIFT